MTTIIRLPTVLRRLAEDQKEIDVEAETVGSALKILADRYPSLGQQLLAEDGSPRPFVRVFLGNDDIHDLQGIGTPLPDGSQLRVVPAIAGGADA